MLTMLLAAIVPLIQDDPYVFNTASTFSANATDLIYQNGYVSNLCWGATSPTLGVYGKVRFRGGFFTGANQLKYNNYPTTLIVRSGAQVWIENTPIQTPGVDFKQTQPGEVFLSVAGSQYASWYIQHGTLVCEGANVLNPEGGIVIWDTGSNGGTLDLGGYDQTVAVLKSTSATCRAADFVTSSSRDAKLVARVYEIGGVAQEPGWYGSCVVVPNADGSLPEKPSGYQYPQYRPSRDIRVVHARDGIGNFLSKCRAGKEVNVAYFGGSITAMTGWRNLTTAWLQEQYPSATINEIAASIGGTGSDLGVFRLKADVLDKNPDFVFVEFAVNDGDKPARNIWRQMEGIVRQIWTKDPEIDIVFCYTVAGGIFDEYANGKYNRSAAAMEQVAEHYGIMSISLGVPAVELYKNDGLVVSAGDFATAVPKSDPDYDAKVRAAMDIGDRILFANDGVHPRAEGHALYLEAVKTAFAAVDGLSAVDNAPKLATVFASDNWESAKTVPIPPAALIGEWTDDTELGGFKMTGVPGAQIAFAFRGTACRMRIGYQPDGGIMKTKIDGAAVADVVGFDSSSTYVRDGSVTLFDGEDGTHDVRMTLSATQPDRTILSSQFADPATELAKAKYNGTVFRVAQLLLVGDLLEDIVIDDGNAADYAAVPLIVGANQRLVFRLSPTAADMTFSGAVSGVGEIVVENTGTKAVIFTGSFEQFTGRMHSSAANTGTFYLGGGWNAPRVNGRIEGASTVSGASAVTFFGAEVLGDGVRASLGHGAGPTGALNLNGFDQTIGTVALQGSAYQPSHASYQRPSYEIKSATAATLTLTDGILFPGSSSWKYPTDGNILLRLNGAASLVYTGTGTVTFRGASTTTGRITVKSGTVVLDADEATFANVTGLTAEGAGRLEVGTTQIKDGVALSVSGDGAIALPEGSSVSAGSLTIDGVMVFPGSYTAEQVGVMSGGRITGAAVTVRERIITETTTYTWIGGGEDDLLTTGANWEGGVAPKLAGGDEILVFTAGANGSSSATASGDVDVCGVHFQVAEGFTLKGPDGAKLYLGTNGLDSVAAPAGVTLEISPCLFGSQTWTIPAGTRLALSNGWSSVAGMTLTKAGAGDISFSGDVSGFKAAVNWAAGNALANGPAGVGGAGSVWTVPKATGTDVRTIGTVVTNEAALVLAGGPAISPANVEFVQEGAVTNNAWGAGGFTLNASAGATLRLRGGIGISTSQMNYRDHPETYPTLFSITEGGNVWVEDKPIDVCYRMVRQQQFGVLHLKSTGNTWGWYDLQHGELKCEAEGVLCPSGFLQFSKDAYAHVNLNGFDQETAVLRTVDAGAESRYVTSPDEAVLTVSGDGVYGGRMNFRGKAGLHFAGSGMLTLSNDVSVSSGPLAVSSGTLSLANGAAWPNATNVTVSSTGLLLLDDAAVDAGAVSQNATLHVSGSGRIHVPSGKTVVVRYLYLDGEPTFRNEYRDGFVTGGGSVRVLKSSAKGGLIMLLR